jgi:LysR family transcriptional regulator, hca operon transcriptional activator
MELRHLRYFIAVAEEGSFNNAAEPANSRARIGAGCKALGTQGARHRADRGRQIFLDHARLVLMQLEAAGEAARRAEQTKKPGFVIGFVAGQEVVWLSETLRILREEAPDIEIMISSQSSPELVTGLMQNKMDVALLRRETQAPGLGFKFLIKEPLVVIMSAKHHLAARKRITPQELACEVFIGAMRLAPVLKSATNDYAAKVGITLQQKYDAENISGAMSLVVSTGGVTLLPTYVQNILSRQLSLALCRVSRRPSI